MAFERTFHIQGTVFQRHARVSVALGNALRDQFCNPQQLLFACFPYPNHDSPWRNTSRVLRCRLLRSLSKVLLDALEKDIDMFSHVFCVVLLDNFLEG